jgi:acid phosphatase type 7
VAEQVVIAVGDMCGPGRRNPGATATAALARRIIAAHPSALILALGDNAYNRGKADEYRDHYTPTWGQPDLLGRTYSCAGNHDYRTAAATPYFEYFGEARAGTPQRSYFSVPLPEAGWHLLSLNSEIDQDAHSPQLQWLRRDLAERRFPPILAMWHRPRWGSGAHRDSKKPRWFWNEMFAARAELILNGHAHHYERFAPQRPDQIPDPQGPRMFIVGTGGRKLAGRTKDTPNSEYARFDKFGVLKLTLRPASYRWEFIDIDDRVLDTGETPVNQRGTSHGTQPHPQ